MSQRDTRRNFMKGALAAGLVGEASLSALNAADSSSAAAVPHVKPRIMYYTDGRHPLVYMYEPPMRKEEFRYPSGARHHLMSEFGTS